MLEQTFTFRLRIDKILTDAHNWSESVSLIISNREMHYATILETSRESQIVGHKKRLNNDDGVGK